MVNEYVIVDGYNVIYAWNELKSLSDRSFHAARMKLQDILCNYQGYTKCTVILVFDGYKAKGGTERIFQYHNIHVIYTKEKETADQYIERVTGDIARDHPVRVVTSDAVEQLIILGKGASRMSSREFLKEVEAVNQRIRKDHLEGPVKKRNALIDNLPKEAAEMLEQLRLKETD